MTKEKKKTNKYSNKGRQLKSIPVALFIVNDVIFYNIYLIPIRVHVSIEIKKNSSKNNSIEKKISKEYNH